jgi:hypothetical protein
MCLSELTLADCNSSASAHTEMEEQKGFAELYDTDEFRLYCFKILPCSKVGAQWTPVVVLARRLMAARCSHPFQLLQRVPHNWKQCVFAHWGEKARRRDLRTHAYSSQLCPDAKREGGCPRGDACTMSHNVRSCLAAIGSVCIRTYSLTGSPCLRELQQPYAGGFIKMHCSLVLLSQ